MSHMARFRQFGTFISTGTTPTLVGTPALIGTPMVGVAIGYTPTATTGIPTPTTTQQWTLDAVDIGGATGATYTPVAGDATHALRVRQIATNSKGTANATSSPGTVAAAPTVTSAGVRVALGVNMPPYPYYERTPGPVNRFAAVDQLKGFKFEDPSGNGVTLVPGADDWPTSDFLSSCWSGSLDDGVQTLTVEFEGQGTVTFNQARGGTNLQFVGYNSSTNRTTYTYTYDPTYLNLGPSLKFSNTKRSAGSPVNTGVKNMYCWAPGDVGNRTDRWTSKLVTFLTDFTVMRTMDLQGTNTDRTTTSFASDRMYEAAGGQPVLTSVQAFTNLANLTGKDLWCQIPINATSDWISGFFGYLFTNLNASQKVYFGVGNENWNASFTGFEQAVVNTCIELHGAVGGGLKGQDSVVTRGIKATGSFRLSNVVTLQLNYKPDNPVGDKIYVTSVPSVTNGAVVLTAVDTVNNTISFASAGVDGQLASINSSVWFHSLNITSTLRITGSTNVYAMAQFWCVRKLIDAADQVKGIVGASNFLTRFRPVLEEQQVSGSGTSNLSYASSYMGSTNVGSKLYALAGAPYFGLGTDAAAGGGTNMNCNSGNTCPPHTVQEYADNFTFSAAYSKYYMHDGIRTAQCLFYQVKNLHYEGGPDVAFNAGTGNNSNKNLAKYTTQTFGDAHLNYLKDMGMCGVTLHMHYSLSVVDSPNSTGIFTWGFTDRTTNVTPYWQSFKDYNALSAGSLPSTNLLDGTISVPTQIDGSICAGRVVATASYPGFSKPNIYPDFNQQNWLITVPTGGAGTYSLVVEYGCTFTPNHFNVVVNGVTVAGATNIAMSNTGSLTTYTSTASITGLPLLEGVNGVRLTAVENHSQNNEAIKSLTFTRTA